MYSGISTAVTRLLIRYRWVLLTVAALLALVAYLPGSRLTLDRSIDTMFAPNDPLLADYRHLKRTFQGNDMVLCVYDDEGLLSEDQSGMARSEEIAQQLDDVPGVRGVLTLGRPIGPEVVRRDISTYSDLRALFEGFTHGADGRTTCAAVILNKGKQTTEERTATIDGIRAIVEDLPGDLGGGVVTGEPVMLDDAFRLIEADGRRLVWLTTVLLSAIILFCFRSIRWVLIPVCVVQLALLLTNGFLAAAGVQMTMVSSMLTAVVTVVGIATVIHVIVRFREGRQSGLSPQEALARTGRRLSGPIFWACFTDAIGFCALMAADVAPIRDFGMMMAVGTFMVFVSAALLIPGLALWGESDNSPATMWGESLLGAQLQWLVRLSKNYAGPIAFSLVVLATVSAIGISRLEIETDFTRNFRSNSELVQSYEVVESKLGGAGLCDVVLKAPDRLTWEYFERILKFEDKLRQEVTIVDAQGDSQPGLTKVISLADVLVSASPFDLRKMRSFARKPAISAALKLMHSRIPSFYEAMYSQNLDEDGQHYFRIMLRAKERQPAAQKIAIINKIRKVCDENLEPDESRVTGYFVLLTNLINGILQDQWRTFGVALVGIGLTMFVALRNIRLALIALVPNALPILLVNGFMGWFGLKANMGAAMIAAVSVGLSIDSSIHYLFAYRHARREGYSTTQALEQVQDSVGRALVFSTLALIVGFTGLAVSQFIPTIYFGVLVSLAMLGGLLGNLLWLPALIRLIEPAEDPVRETMLSSKSL